MRHRHQSGSIFTLLLMGIVIAAGLSLVLYQTVSGPVASMVRITNKTSSKATGQNVLNIVTMDAVNNASADCDSDGAVEPRAWRAATGGAGSYPAGGGLIPSTIGAPLTDEWGTEFGYCVWDVGSVIRNGTCSDDARRLSGTPSINAGTAVTQTTIAVISAGPNRNFETTCRNYIDASSDVVIATTGGASGAGGDDILQRYTYTQMASNTPSLWTLKTSDSTTAIIDKNLEVGTSGSPSLTYTKSTGVLSITGTDTTTGALTSIGQTYTLTPSGAASSAKRGALFQTNLTGSNGSSDTIALKGYAYNTGTGATSDVTGVSGRASRAATGTGAAITGVRGLIENATGTVTNAYGLRVSNLVNTGTLTNTYGLHIGTMTTGTQTNQAYGLYQSSSSDRNYLAGNTGIGTDPSAILHVKRSTAGGETVRVENTSGYFSMGADTNGGYAQSGTASKGFYIYNNSGNTYVAAAGAGGVIVRSDQVAAAATTPTLLDMAQTWNTNLSPTAVKLNITDSGTANAGALLMDLQTGGTSQFAITKNGHVYSSASVSIGQNVTGASLDFSLGRNARTGGMFDNTRYGFQFNRPSNADRLDLQIYSGAGTFIGYGPRVDSLGGLRLGLISATGSSAPYPLDLSTTWNTTGSPKLIYADVTNTASGSNASLIDLRVTTVPMLNFTPLGKLSLYATNTAAGTTGAQTINRTSGTVNFAAGASSLTVTNSLATTSSLIFATARTNDATAYVKNVVPANGSFTINLGAAATAETSVGFLIIN